MLPVLAKRLLSLAIFTSFISGCASGARNWADRTTSLSAHNTSKTWVRDRQIADVTKSPTVSILRKGQTLSFKNFAEALKNYREGDEIKLANEIYPFAEEVTVPKEVRRVLISGQGHESILRFVTNFGTQLYAPRIKSHVPLTFRDVQIFDPRLESTTPEARVWFEGAYASGSFIHHGRELMAGTPAEVFIMGGYYSLEGPGRIPQRETVLAFQPHYLFSVTYTPNLSMENSHYSAKTLNNLDNKATVAPALFSLGKEFVKLRKDGGYAMPSEKGMMDALAEIYVLTRLQRNEIHPAYGSAAMIRDGNRVTLEAFSRLANYLQSKTGGKTEVPLTPQVLASIDKANLALKNGAPATAIFMAMQYDVPKFHPRYKEIETTVDRALTTLGNQHGCKISINVKGSVSGSDFSPARLSGHVRSAVGGLYPAAHIESKSANGCAMSADVYKSTFDHWKSEISSTVTTMLVETDQARTAREAALAANSRDTWKEAFSSIGNAAMKAGDRSRQVWQNQEKTRTRVEERGSGTYLVYYKGNTNLPPSKIATEATAGLKQSATSSSPAQSGATNGLREKKAVRERYYLYGSHEVDYEIAISDAGKLATKFERTKHRLETKRGPCESESVDGWSATLISGNCYVTGLPRSNEIDRAMIDAWVAYLTTNRLPKVASQVRDMYAKGNRLNQAEAVLVAALYGGQPEGKGLDALKTETDGIYKFSAPNNVPVDLATALSLANML